jgi:uncharacterized FAD-dependent dehydrogenase
MQTRLFHDLWIWCSGAYSDGKFNITNEFGGWMNEYLSETRILELIKYVDEINLKQGAS